MQLSLFFHVIGMVMWLGGLMLLTRMLTIFVTPYTGGPELPKLVRKSWFGFVIGGLALSTLSGLYQVFAVGLGIYMKQGWFHGKMTLLILLFVVTALVGVEVAKVARQQVLTKPKQIVLHALTGLCLVGIAFMTMVLRTSHY